MTKQRIEFIDLAKGFCILLVVLAHVFGHTSGAFIEMMDVFRMPLYFILSGLFFKTYGGIFPFFKKKTNKLLIPFICSYLFIILPTNYLLQNFALSGGGMFLIDKGRLNLGINGASWFLLCLFTVNILFYFLFSLCKNNIWCIAVCATMCGIAGYLLNIDGLYLPMWLDSSLTVMPFFLMGYAMRKYSNVLYGHFSIKSWGYFLVSLAVLLFVYYANKSQHRGVICFCDNNLDIGALSIYIGGFAGTCCVLMAAKYFKRLPVLSYTGRYSIVVLLTHLLYLFILRNVLYQLKIDQSSCLVNLAIFIIIVALSLPTIKFCIRFLPYCFAQKDLWK